MSQYEYQRCLDGSVEVLQSKSVLQLMDEMGIGESLDSRERVRQAVIAHPETQTFILYEIPKAQTRQESHEAFTQWLYAIPSFEAWARTARKYAEGVEFSSSATPLIPDWYATYLTTEYWSRKRAEVLDSYKCCVLCATRDGKLDTHHRTYTTLGQEKIWDLSLLCDSCHFRVHRFLSMCFPHECPDAVSVIIEREKTLYAKLQEATR